MECQELHIPDNPQYRELKRIIEEYRNVPGPLIQVLNRAQRIFGYLPREVQLYVSRELNVPLSEVYGVVTFYNFFKTEPVGKHIVNVCLGTACHVKGAQRVVDALANELKVEIGQTSQDGFYTLSTARCFGACGLAPAMMIDDEVYGRLTPGKAVEVLKEFQKNETNQN
ncbi:MAG TPA: NAD(P)H-dependent oxidoreductase subunit E [Candidatus Aminicenantes bacterium]|nr:NAD(P)H-dependent oxidoreductase subunit E [Candidatus Aminicenantes bacterium]